MEKVKIISLKNRCNKIGAKATGKTDTKRDTKSVTKTH